MKVVSYHRDYYISTSSEHNSPRKFRYAHTHTPQSSLIVIALECIISKDVVDVGNDGAVLMRRLELTQS